MADEPTPSAPETPPAGDADHSGNTAEAVQADLEAKLAQVTAAASGRDRAAAAEKKALETRLAELEAEKQQREANRMTEDNELRATNERLQQELEQERAKVAASDLAARTARFPNAAEALGEGFAVMNEETLTGLEQRLTAQSEGGMILPTSAARPAAGNIPKPTEDMSLEELRTQLKSQVEAEWPTSGR